MGNTPVALVTGGAGLIGSHVADLAVANGWHVRVMDNLERNTHRGQQPQWLGDDREFLHGDVRNRRDWEQALDGVDYVFHLAAYGGYMPELSKFMHVNSYGTALMLETIRNRNLPIRKLVVASSQAVYLEGAYSCPSHGYFFGAPRAHDRLQAGDFFFHCPQCDAIATPAPITEDAPIGGENVYAISKFDQERLVRTFGIASGLPVVALRFSCTYGPRQSVFNPYTGVIAIFCTRLLNGLAPLVYEDGLQSRDLVFVEDVARANLLVAEDDRADQRVFNVGTGQAAGIADLANMLARKLGIDIEPEIPGAFRPGEMRSLISDISALAELGFQPQVDLATGIDRYLDWIRTQGDIQEYFGEAHRQLQKRSMVKQVAKS